MADSKPLVSILIPCFNAESFIGAAIESAVGQSWPNKEVIVVDDGSTDRSFEIASSYASEIVKVVGQKNSGACRARNWAFELSKGQFIQYLDADDILAVDKIENQLKLIGEDVKDTLFTCRWLGFVGSIADAKSNSQAVYKDYADPKELLLEMWLSNEMLQTSVWLTPRQLVEKVGKWNESLLINQDGDFFSRIVMASGSVVFCKDAVVYYRKGVKTSISNSKIDANKARSWLNSYKNFEQLFSGFLDKEEVRKAIAKNYYSFAYRFYNKHTEIAMEAIKNGISLKVSPRAFNFGGRAFKAFYSLIGFSNALKLKKKVVR